MTVQEVLLKAIAGELHWFRAAEILGWSPRTVRRWRERYEAFGDSGLIDKRLLRPSLRRVSPAHVEQVLRLYRERYAQGAGHNPLERRFSLEKSENNRATYLDVRRAHTPNPAFIV
jgi:transposase